MFTSNKSSQKKRTAVIRGSVLSKWELQNFEPLCGEWDLCVIGAKPNQYPTENITLPIKWLNSADAHYRKAGLAARAAARLKLIKKPSEEIVGLEDALAEFAVAHAADTSIPFSEQAIRAKQQYGLKVVLTCWETIPFAYQEDAVVRERCKTVRANADLFLATTRRAARALEIEGVEPERICVVMPGVDTERFQPCAREPELMARYGITAGDVVLLFIGRLIQEKGARELLVALALMQRLLPLSLACRCRLLIAGNGPQRDFLQSLIADLNLASSVRIIGCTDYMQIHRLHQLADVFVLPSIATPYWEEQYGMVLAEAMACGTAVISTRTGGIPEVVGEAGLLVPQLEPEALSESLASLVKNTDLRAELGDKARIRAVNFLNAANAAQQISDAYHHVLLPASLTAS